MEEGGTDSSVRSVEEFDGTFTDRGEEAERGRVVGRCGGVPEKVEDGCGLREELGCVRVEQLKGSVL